MVRLYAASLGRTQAFECEHAARLLRMNNSGWILSPGEKVEWTGNGFRPRKNKKGDK